MTATYHGEITLPIFTRATEDGDLIYLGDVTINVPIDLEVQLPLEGIQEALTGVVTPSTIQQAEGPHSRACGVQPHQHGTACHPNCPTCGTDGLNQAGPLGDGCVNVHSPATNPDCEMSPYTGPKVVPASDGSGVSIPDGPVNPRG